MKKNAVCLLEKLVRSSRMPPTGEMGPQVQDKQAKHLKVDPLYAQTISVKIPDRLLKMNQKTVQKHEVYK